MNIRLWFKERRGLFLVFLMTVLAFLAVAGALPRIIEYHHYQNGTISYNGREYQKSTVQTLSEADAAYFAESEATGVYILGGQVYDIPGSPYASTVIYLKTKEGEIQIYELKGGP